MTKHLIYILSAFLLGLASCKKNGGSGSEADPQPIGVPTAVGVPTGAQSIEQTIGADGGSVRSRDGRVRVIIPAGALSTTRSVSIQPITNFNPLGIGTAYRITPHDVNFSKAVAIEFTYTDEEIDKTAPEALGIAYQDTAGIWQVIGGHSLNKTGNTVTINTKHFSDWSLFESVYLESSATVLNVGATATLQVFTTEDLVVPLDPAKQVAMGRKVSLAASLIKEWKLAGAGRLQPDGAKAHYTAPATVPTAPNPIAVSASIDIKGRGTCLLFKHIQIVADDGEIVVNVAGNGPVTKAASVAVQDEEGYWLLADQDGDSQGSYVFLVVPNQLGTHPYRSPESNSGTYFHYLVTGYNNYICQYSDAEENLLPSGGGITVTSLGEEDGFIRGTYSVQPAGYGDLLRNTINIEGSFRVRKAVMPAN